MITHITKLIPYTPSIVVSSVIPLLPFLSIFRGGMKDNTPISRDLIKTKVDRQTIPSLRLKQQQHYSVNNISAPLPTTATGAATIFTGAATIFDAVSLVFSVLRQSGRHLKKGSKQQNGKQQVHSFLTLF